MVAGTAGISGWCARAVLRACNGLAPSPSAGTNVRGRWINRQCVVIRSGALGPRTPTLGTKADAARPPASRLIRVTARFRAALTVAQGLLPSPCGSLAEGVVRG